MTALFDRLYADLNAPVLNRVRHMVGDPEAAEDICQEVWAKLADRLDEYAARPDFNGPALVSRAAKNKALDHLRRGQSVAAGGRVNFYPIEAAANAPTPDGLPDPVLLRGEAVGHQRALVGALLEAMPTRESDAIWWREYGRRSYAEIAHRTESTAAAIKTLLFRARHRLDAMVRLETRLAAGGGGTLARFAEFVDDSGGPSACWPWLGSFRNRDWKNPAIRVAGERNGRVVNAHRVAYAIRYGPLPPGVYPLLGCGSATPDCVNPAHVIAGRKAGGGPGTAGGQYAPLTPGLLRLVYDPPRGRDLAARRAALGLGQTAFARATGLVATSVWKAEQDRDRYAIGVAVVAQYVAALDRLERERTEGSAA